MHIFPSFFSLSLSSLSLCHILSSRTKRTSVRNFFSKNLLSRVTVFQDGERRLLAESASNFNPSCTPLPPMYNKSFNPDGGKEKKRATWRLLEGTRGFERVRFLHSTPKGYLGRRTIEGRGNVYQSTRELEDE